MNPQTASLIRLLLVFGAGALVTHGWLASEQQDAFVTAAAEVVGGATALVSLFWSRRDKKRTGEAIQGALALPAYSTLFDLKTAPALGGFKDLLIRQAILTVMSLLADKVSRSRFGRHLIQLRDALNMAFPPAG